MLILQILLLTYFASTLAQLPKDPCSINWGWIVQLRVPWVGNDMAEIGLTLEDGISRGLASALLIRGAAQMVSKRLSEERAP